MSRAAGLRRSDPQLATGAAAVKKLKVDSVFDKIKAKKAAKQERKEAKKKRKRESVDS